MKGDTFYILNLKVNQFLNLGIFLFMEFILSNKSSSESSVSSDSTVSSYLDFQLRFDQQLLVLKTKI